MFDDRTDDDTADFLLISSIPEFGFLCRVRQKTALYQHRGTLNVFHQPNPLAFLGGSVAAGIQMGYKGFLQLFRQFPASVCGGPKHLSAAVTAVGIVVLMDAQQDGIIRVIDDPGAFFQIRNLLFSDGIAMGLHR